MNCGYHWVLGYKTLQTCSHIHTTHLQNAFLETISITTLHFHYKQSSRKCKQREIRKQALHVLASFPGGGRRESLISTACACVQFAMKFHGSWMLLCNIYVMMMSTLWFHCFLQGYSCVTLWAFHYLQPPAPWMQSNDFQTTAESVCEICIRGKGHSPGADHWFWRVNMLRSSIPFMFDVMQCSVNSP